ncbi:hypothetical protein CesoFtcFv8_019900 [Champsocephalus esox]|uniref:Uncharacterized protein n=1 Tax=Champsocephalus esox TaxID=159716 RepID=A0AAN8BFA6_9TELE|nr:hypothetical protein CesoFtcFv8_019900 [Champsocephalus esox]
MPQSERVYKRARARATPGRGSGNAAVTKKFKPNSKQDSNQDNLAGRGSGNTAITAQADTNLTNRSFCADGHSSWRTSKPAGPTGSVAKLHADSCLQRNP